MSGESAYADAVSESLISEKYSERERRFSALSETQARAARRLSWLRLVTGLILIVLLYRLASQGVDAIEMAATLLSASLFIFLVRRHQTRNRHATRYRVLARLNAQAAYRLARDWNRLTAPEFSQDREDSHLATDLNLVGHASLLHLLNLQSMRARRLLLDWLHVAVASTVIKDRQQVVDELAPGLDHRQSLGVVLDAGASELSHDEQLVRWAEQDESGAQYPPRWLLIILTVTSVSIPVAVGLGIVAPHVLLAVLVVNVALSYRYLPSIHQELDSMETNASALQYYATLIDFVCAEPAQSPRLVHLQEVLQSPGVGAVRAVRQAQYILWLADLRNSGMIYLFLQVMTLWSLHVYGRLRSWRREAGPSVRRWLDALAEYEVLAALAGIRHDHPDWCFPVITVDSRVFYARAIGHPLLPPARQVHNDVEIDRDRKPLLLVTGSNMSGKSTLMRSIGINMLLAKTGAPVCAAELKMPNAILTTCFGSHDSLVDGVSLYMAELRCLKSSLDHAHSAGGADHPVFFLLDEILRGTNSRDRHIATVFVLNQLIQAGAMGAVATHDVDLVETPDLKAYCDPVYFVETIEETTHGFSMNFDYVLRPGIAKSSNALRLLQVAGLGAPESDGATPRMPAQRADNHG